jgi:predicted nucleotidyltransferase
MGLDSAKARSANWDPALEDAIRRGGKFLAAQPGVTRVWLFGSAAKGRKMDWRSDLDFAVEGLDPMAQGRVWSELDQFLKRDVDLVCMEDVSPELKGEILRYGIVLEET